MRSENTAPQYSKEVFKEQLFTTFVSANLPFQLVENHSFKKLLEIACLGIDMPNRRQLRKLLDICYESATEAFLSDLGNRTKVSLVIDCWSSPNKIAFIAIVGYYILVEWKYKEVLLAFEPLTGAHMGRNLALVVERILAKYELTDRLFNITTDNASSNATMRESLEQALSGKHNVVGDAEVAKVSCLAHVLNLSAKAFLLGVKVADAAEPDEGHDFIYEEPYSFVPDMAENSVARTVVKVSLS
jgi:hypothetical protein